MGADYVYSMLESMDLTTARVSTTTGAKVKEELMEPEFEPETHMVS